MTFKIVDLDRSGLAMLHQAQIKLLDLSKTKSSQANARKRPLRTHMQARACPPRMQGPAVWPRPTSLVHSRAFAERVGGGDLAAQHLGVEVERRAAFALEAEAGDDLHGVSPWSFRYVSGPRRRFHARAPRTVSRLCLKDPKKNFRKV